MRNLLFGKFGRKKYEPDPGLINTTNFTCDNCWEIRSDIGLISPANIPPLEINSNYPRNIIWCESCVQIPI